MQFDGPAFKAFRLDLQASLQQLEQKYGVTMKAGKFTYNDVEFSFKTEVVNKNVVQNGVSIDGERAKFNNNCMYYGFTPDFYGKVAMFSGKPHVFIGFNPSKPKNNCSIKEVATGKIYGTNDKTLKSQWNMLSSTGKLTLTDAPSNTKPNYN